MKNSDKSFQDQLQIAPVKKYFENKDEIGFAYLFGSAAKNKENRLSDIDIALFINEKEDLPEESAYGYEAGIITDLMDIFKRNDIDVVLLNKAGLFLKYQILRNGRLIFCRKNKDEAYFRFKVYQEYLDTKRLRNINNDYFLKRIRENH